MEYVLLTAASLLSVFGFVHMVKSLVFWLSKLPEKGMYIVTKLESAESAEAAVRSVMERVKWMKIPARIIFTFKDGDLETEKIAGKIVSEYADVKLVPENDLDLGNH